MKRLVLKRGREKSLRRHHPWIFSGALESLSVQPASGETVEVVDAAGAFLAYAAFSPRSQMRARAWSFDQSAQIDAAFMRETLTRSIDYRRQLAIESNAMRLVHAESDGLPGLIVDRYGTTAVVQFLSAGAEYWREAIIDTLYASEDCTCVYERSDAEVRALEGLEPQVGVLRGTQPSTEIAIEEAGLHFRIDVGHGQKTGFFLDQRDNRQILRAHAANREVLDVFSYTGGFSVAALRGGASRVSMLDSSADALARARVNLAANDLEPDAVEALQTDAFSGLRDLHRRGRRFDVVVLDPPKFAPSEKHVPKATRAYKDINLWALRLLRPGGLLFTFSCSGGVGDTLFQSVVAGAAVDAGVDGRIVRRLGAAPDHPVALNFPEAHYLKGLLIARA